MAKFKPLDPIALGLMLAISGWGQSSADQKHQPGAARKIGSGAGTAGTGAAKSAGDVAKGTGKGAANLVTLHPINAGVSIGKGAATAGKDVTVGTVKGTGKVAKGVGRVFTRLF